MTVDETFSDLKAAVRQARRAFAHSPESKFALEMREAMEEYVKARAAGVGADDAQRGLETVLRDAWPHRPSKFSAQCQACDDTGWAMRFCDAQLRCGRERCARHPEVEHAYVEACACARGERMRGRTRTVVDALTAAGKTQKKARSWQRLGT